MRVSICALTIALPILVAVTLGVGQTNPNKNAPAKEAASSQEIGKSYSRLQPEQKRLVDDYVKHYNQTTGTEVVLVNSRTLLAVSSVDPLSTMINSHGRS